MSSVPPASGYGLSAPEAARAARAPELPYLPLRPRRFRPRIALVGCGGVSEYHLRAYRAMGLDVVALCSRDRARAEARRAEFFPAAGIFTSYDELLRVPGIDVVDLALHPPERVGAIEAALRAGKHVLSQKPFVLDLDVGERLAQVAGAHGVRLAVNQNGRWAPHFSYLAAAVRAGVIGEVATIDFTVQWDHTWTAGTAFEAVPHLVLFDFGIHWFDMCAHLFPGRRARTVSASVTRASFQTIQPALVAQAVVAYGGAQVRFNFNGHVQHGQEDRTVICGREGTLRSAGPNLSEQSVTLHTKAGTATVPLEGTWFTHGFQGAMGELLCAVEENREPAHGARNNLESLALCFAAVASAEAGGKPVVPGEVRTLVGS